jgi:Domain of unknown function (DUF4352)
MRARRKRAGHRVRWKTAVAGSLALLTLIVLIASPVLVYQALRGWQSHRAAVANTAAQHFGEVTRDGAAAFVVHSVQCGLSTVGGTTKPANGQFCVVRVTVRNDGDNPVTLEQAAQRATGSRGAFYLPDPAADAVVGTTDSVVAPGASRDTAYVFDIPSGVSLTEIEMHAAEYSRGADVRLSARH